MTTVLTIPTIAGSSDAFVWWGAHGISMRLHRTDESARMLLNDFLQLGLDISHPVVPNIESQEPVGTRPGVMADIEAIVRKYGGLTGNLDSWLINQKVSAKTRIRTTTLSLPGQRKASVRVHHEPAELWTKLGSLLGFILDELETIRTGRWMRQPRSHLPYHFQGPGSDEQWIELLSWLEYGNPHRSVEELRTPSPGIAIGQSGLKMARTDIRHFLFNPERYVSTGTPFDFRELVASVVDRIHEDLLQEMSKWMNRTDAQKYAEAAHFRKRLSIRLARSWENGLKNAQPRVMTSAMADFEDSIRKALPQLVLYSSKRHTIVPDAIKRLAPLLRDFRQWVRTEFPQEPPSFQPVARLDRLLSALVSTTTYSVNYGGLSKDHLFEIRASGLYSFVILHFIQSVVSGAYRQCAGCRLLISVGPDEFAAEHAPRSDKAAFCSNCRKARIRRKQAQARRRQRVIPFRDAPDLRGSSGHRKATS